MMVLHRFSVRKQQERPRFNSVKQVPTKYNSLTNHATKQPEETRTVMMDDMHVLSSIKQGGKEGVM